ncbi:DUF4375 domain-containing protein [Prosthecobacter sp.]|uniref:DMP19 family protein n=1 Tax=Prosthecobacter sp. TaxID=1965333 RepID=UPI003783411F
MNELYSRIKGDRTFAQLSRAEQVLVLTVRLEREVLNGTVWQYMSNSSGDLFDNAVRALDEIGADECSGALSEIATWFEEGVVPRERAARNVQMAGIEDGTTEMELERRVREVNDKLSEGFPKMTRLLVEYLKGRVEEIR